MKGQTAVEYLMTYGWAILIILIVAGVLAYYGIFAPAGFLGPSSKGFTQVTVLQPWDLSSDAVGTLKFQVENRVGQDITITDIKAINGNAIPTVSCALTDPVTGYALITAGTKFPTSGLMTLTCAGAIGGASGSSYTITVEIDYTVGGTALKQTGTLSGSRS
jgi:hypothetical protein